MLNFKQRIQGCQESTSCIAKDGCPKNRCADFTLRRHDTKPEFKVAVEDCDGILDIQGLVVEANMWAMGKLRKKIGPEDTDILLADNIGFSQIMVGDIILFDRVRLPEYILVTGFDEDNSIVHVQRGYRNTTPGTWKKGTILRIFRIMNAPAQTEVTFEDIPQVDGTKLKDQLTSAFLMYEWRPEDTCLPGCYWFEFKLLKMKTLVVFLPGGQWTGPINQNTFFWTGTTKTESSVQLSYDSVHDRYMIPAVAWSGDFHLASDKSYYTGLVHNDGSVYLTVSDKVSPPETVYGSISTIDVISVVISEVVSLVIPSTDPSQIIDRDTAMQEYGCFLGEGVEWERRLPVTGEGFLIKIVDSQTREY